MGGAASEDQLFRTMFNAVPLPLFRVTQEIEILDLNIAAQKLYHSPPGEALRQRGGDLLHCINAVGVKGGCGNAKPCVDCLIRSAVGQILAGGEEISRRRVAMESKEGESVSKLELLLTVTPITYAGTTSALLCLEDISELTSLRTLIPICASCKKIRDDQQLWRSVESYFSRFMQVDFTHGICPDCAKRLYPDFYPKGKD